MAYQATQERRGRRRGNQLSRWRGKADWLWSMATVPPSFWLMRRSPSPSIAYVLSWFVLALMVAASSSGLLLDGVYLDSVNVEAALRGGDLVNLIAVAPILLIAMWLAHRGSIRAHLVWLAMLTYAAYGYAYYIFGPTFNDFFLIHVAIFVLAIVALGFGFGGLDLTALAPRFKSAWLPRVVAGFLVGAMVFMIGNYTAEILQHMGGGELPTDVLPFAEWRVHLGYALDLSLLAPSAVIAGILLWQRLLWGHAVATVELVFLCVFQLSFLSAAIFMSNAGIPDTAVAISQAVTSMIVFAIPAGIMLWGAIGPSRATSVPA